MIQDHQTIVAAIIALFTAGLAYLAATSSARSQAELRRIQQAELVEALRAEVAFRMFRVFAGINSWHDASVNATTVDYETRLAHVMESMPEIFDSAMSATHQAWREVGKLPVKDQRSYRKFLGEAELLIDTFRSSVYGLKVFRGKEVAFYENGWPTIMSSFKDHIDRAWSNCSRVQEEVKRLADS